MKPTAKWRVKGAKGVLSEKVTKPTSVQRVGFAGFACGVTAAGFGFAVGADDNFTLCPVGDFGLAVMCDFVILVFGD